MSVATLSTRERIRADSLFQSLQGAHVRCNTSTLEHRAWSSQPVSIAPGSACPLQRGHLGMEQPQWHWVSIAPWSACPLQHSNLDENGLTLRYVSIAPWSAYPLQRDLGRKYLPGEAHEKGFNRSVERMSVATLVSSQAGIYIPHTFQSLRGAHVRCNESEPDGKVLESKVYTFQSLRGAHVRCNR